MIRAEEARSRRSPIPIVILSANAMSHHLEGYADLPVQGFVAKPIELDALLTAVSQALDQAPATDDDTGERGQIEAHG